jgi:O-antigen/teichoic acid export membrane protein
MTRLTRNVIYNVTGQGLVLVLSLIAVRFIFRRLGDDVFGLIYFNIVLTTLLASAAELGVSSTTVREVSTRHESEPEYVRDLVRTASLLYWGLGILLVLVIWVTAPLLVTYWVNLRTMDAGTAATTIRILSVMSLVALPKVLYTSLFRGRQMMGLNNVIDVAMAASQQAGILVVLLLGGHVYQVAFWISLNAVLGITAYVIVAGRIFGWGSLAPSFSMPVVRRNVRFTANMMAISVLSLVHIQADKVVVSKLLPIAEFGFYGFASSTVSRATFVTAAIAQASFPSFSSLVAAGDRYELLRQYRKLQDLVCFGTLPLFTGICFAALPVFGYIFNAGVAQRLLLPTAFLALGTWMNATINMPYMLSLAMGMPQIAARLNLYALAAVLPVTVLLILRFGLPGAGFSWVFYHLFAYAYMVPRVCRACLESSPWRWYLHVLRPLALAALTYGPAWLLLEVLGNFTLPAVALAYAGGSAAFAGGAYLLIGTDLKETLQRLRAALVVRRADAL